MQTSNAAIFKCKFKRQLVNANFKANPTGNHWPKEIFEEQIFKAISRGESGVPEAPFVGLL